jgi:hypothetical protein
VVERRVVDEYRRERTQLRAADWQDNDMLEVTEAENGNGVEMLLEVVYD